MDTKTAIHGSKALLEFLGPQGKPVELVVAERRAERCRTCQLNGPSAGWVERVAKSIAKATAAYFRIKDGLNLHVANEKALGICAACHCPIKLKIWMPIDYIESHTTDEVMVDFVETCWIPEELQRP